MEKAGKVQMNSGRILRVAAVAAVGLATVLCWRSYVAASDEAEGVLANVARSAAADADVFFAAMTRALDAEVPGFEAFLADREHSDAEITEYLQQRTHHLSTLVDASYVDLYCSHHGRYLCGNYWVPPTSFDPTVRPWYLAGVAAKGETAVAPPYDPADLPDTVIAVARQLRHPETVLSLDVQLTAFRPRVIEARGMRTGCKFFFEPNGSPIDREGEASGTDRDFGKISAAVRNAPRPADGSVVRLDVDGDVVFCGRTKNGWGAVVAQSRAELVKQACWALLDPIPWVLIGYVALCLIVGFVTYRRATSLMEEIGPSYRVGFGQFATLLLVFVVFLGLGMLAHRQILRLEWRIAATRAESLVRQGVEPVVSFVEFARGAAGYCSRRIGRLLQNGATDEQLAAVTRELISIYRSMPNRNYRGIFVARPGWYVDSLGWKKPAGYRIEDQNFYKLAIANPNQNVLTPPYVSVVDGSGLFTVSRAVGDDRNTVVGVDVPLTMMKSLLQQVRLEGALGSITFFGDGRIIDQCDFGRDSKLFGELDFKALAARAMSEQKSFRFDTAADETLFAISVPLVQGLQMLVVGDELMFNSELSPYRGKTLMAFVIIILGVIFGAFVVLRRLRLQQERELVALERAKNADRLEKALKMADSANQAKTTFLFNMSHDIRTPMNAIVGFTGIALKHLGETEKVRECLEKTRQAGEMLMSIINSILDMSRIEAGKAKIEEVEGDVRRSFDRMESSMQSLAKAKDITLTFAFGRLDDCHVYLDPDWCLRVFMNFISNAVKYTPVGGRVSVTCEQVPDEKLRREGRGLYRYTFADNGIGMSEEFQKHLFEEFSRERNSTVSGIQGTGLGLAICKAYVDLMGGTIRCTSKKGEGTTFVVELPLRICEKPTSAEGVKGADLAASGLDVASFAGKRILLVEDNELNREVSNHLLEELGFAVEDAEDGSVAVRMVTEKGFDYYDYVLMDIQMPVMNGHEATKAIRKLEAERGATRRLPIIALSANAFAEDRQASLAAGMDAHVAKPIRIQELLEALAGLGR